MRLIELRLKNLNSLKGEWHIDFTDAAFINEGIFAIIGQTGAGKTTILDAICLALYSRTPRLGDITGSTNEMMTQGTGECSAEVVIEIGDKHYRCSWYQHRARKKAKGNLLPIKHEISDAHSSKVLEEKKSKTAVYIQDLIGMDFNQFTRSIMLAQGSFAAFLKSDVADRAAILEKITGTAIYAEISKNVFEKKRHEENQLAKLQAGIDSLPLLSADDEAKLQAQLTTYKDEQTVQRQTLKTVSNQLQWLDKVTDLQTNLTHYEALEIDAVQAQQGFVPEAARLEAANKALEIDSPFRELLYSRKKAHDLRTEREAVDQQLPIEQQQCKQVMSALEAAASDEVQAATALHDALPIIAKVRDLDSEVNQQARSINDDTAHKNKLAANVETLRRDIKAHQQTESKAKNQLSAIDQFFTDYPELGDLDTDMATFDSNCGRLRTLLEDNASLAVAKITEEQNTSQLQDKADALAQRLELDKSIITQQQAQLTNLQQQQSALIKHQSIANMRGEQDRIGQISNQVEQVGFKLERLAELSGQIYKSKQLIPTLNKQLTALEDLMTRHQSDIQAAKYQQQEKQAHLQLLQKVAKLEDYIIELEDGTPCPLCGAHEHPYGTNHPLLDHHTNSETSDSSQPSQAQQTQHKITEILTLIETLEQTLAAYRVDYATKKAALSSEQQQLENLQAQSNTVASDIHSALSSLIHPQNAYDKALADTIHPLAELMDAIATSIYDTARVNQFIALLDSAKQQLNQQKQAIYKVLTDYDARAEQIATLNSAIEVDEKQQQALIDSINNLTTDIKLMSQKNEGITDKINANFSDMSPIMATVSTQVDKYPTDKYEDYLNTALDAAEVQAALMQLRRSIETKTVLSQAEYDNHINPLRQQRVALNLLKQTFNTQIAKQQQLTNDLSRLTAQIGAKQQQLASDEISLEQLENSLLDKTVAHQQSKTDRYHLFADKNPDSESNSLHTALDEAKNKTAILQRQVDNTRQVFEQSKVRADQLADDLNTATTVLNEQQTTFTALLSESQFVSEADFEQSLLPKEARDALKNRQFSIEQALNHAKVQLQATQQSLNEQLANPLTDEPRDILAGKLQNLQTEVDTRFGVLGAIEQQLKANEQQKIAQSTQSVAIAAQKEAMQVWQQLYDLIGSKDGKKYRTFAQGLTFQVMIDHANKQLGKMSDRYLLIHDTDNALELNVIDNYQGGDIRSTKNLSGGEGFIISLALALGLSQMASQNIRVDSLFLDEGFGTLDEESLDIALDTLTSLQQEGKIIGIISHVQALKERILTQIKVEKISGGFSQISGQGCRKVVADDE
ncbi:AAA family ATPase [Psychrobacter sp. NG254]|uniref:AAA family ATPase n=1 Tax=Psychrobacter sp. NG254 TaxID=2782003 RepID=UPI0018899112|nr:AAA family ATPase [Psychrobacter sp. NG254]MBF2719912.1 AAA family ATPase [Psychrobacter sp. NG254]